MTGFKNKNCLGNIDVNRFNYIIIFLVMYLSSSFYGLSIQGTIAIILSIATCILAILINFKNIRFNIKAMLFFIIVTISSIFTMIINNDGIYYYIIFWMFFGVSYLIHCCINIQEFILIYNRIMYFLCIFSLITFLVLIIYPSIFKIFPEITNKVNLTVRNIFFSTVRLDGAFKSNYGMFWEPGVYQTFINLALFFQIFILKDLNNKYIIIYIITIFTTFSTTGYIACLFILSIFFICNIDNTYKILVNKRTLIYKIIIILIIGIILFVLLPENIKFKVFGKLEALINPNIVNNSAYISTVSRSNSIKEPVEMFMSRPILGVGFSNIYELDMVTCTPINWFAFFGLIIGLLFNQCLFRWTCMMKKRYILRFFLLLFLLLIVLSQYLNINAFYLMFLFYSFDIDNLKYK